MNLFNCLKPTCLKLRTAFRMISFLRNWPEVIVSSVHAKPAVLIFRNGLIVEGGAGEDPRQGFEVVFCDCTYRRVIEEPDGGHLIDIGANIGALTLDWLRRIPSAVVHAYEPNPSAYNALKRNVARNGFVSRARLHNEAVWSRAGILNLHQGKSNSVATSAFPNRHSDGEGFSVASIGFDEAIARCPDNQRVRLLKIDTEGAEAEILEGASPDSLSRIDQCILEYHDFRVPGALQRSRAVLERNRFRCLVIPSSDSCGILYALSIDVACARI